MTHEFVRFSNYNHELIETVYNCKLCKFTYFMFYFTYILCENMHNLRNLRGRGCLASKIPQRNVMLVPQ